jgi:hypothetical protein
MSAGTSILRGKVVAIAAVLAFAAAGSAIAGPTGGHGGGGGHAAVGGGYRGGYGGFRGGYYGGFRGYGGYGWRGGWGWGGWGCCGWGLGWYLPFLPLGYATYYWGSVPYYYVDNNYYVWDGSVGQYQAVQPPSGLTPTPGTAPAGAPPTGAAPGGPPGQWTDLFAYPKGGQSMEQQTRDRDECHRWAVAQTGYDPAQSQGNPNEAMGKREGYLRAETACLEGRNYSVK